MSNPAGSALINMRRSPYQTLAAIMVLTISFFITYIFTMLIVGSEFVLRYFETQPQITAFFQTDTPSEVVANTQQTMQSQSNVKSVKVISKDEALQIYQEDNKEDPLLLQLVTADILPASIEVQANSIDALPEIETQLKAVPEIDEVIYQKDIVDALAKWTKSLRLVGAALISLLITTSIFVIIVITGMKVASKRTTIRVMQLIGASRWYIKAPFLFEGVYYGIFGAILGWIGVYTLSLYLTPWLLEFLKDIPVVPVPPIFMFGLLGAGVLSGTIIGFIASWFASQRFFKY